MQTIIIGHKNPDMDSICSAVGYARLKKLQGQSDVMAARAGNTNKRIDYVLHRFGVEPPPFLSDVSPRVADAMERRVISLPAGSPIHQAINIIEQNQLRGLPVTDRDGRCLGLLSAFKVSQHLFPLREDVRRARVVKASLSAIMESFGGRILAGAVEDAVREYRVIVAAMSRDELSRRIERYSPREVLLCVGDREDVQRLGIEFGARAILVSGALPVSEPVLQEAKRNDVAVISSAFDTASTVLFARGAVSVDEMLDQDFESFRPESSLESARAEAAASRWFLFPVIGEDGMLAGILSKSDFLKSIPRQLILVDHNELSQAVDGADKLPIVEVLDHHRLGGYSTRTPIHFWNNPVGSTSTIVALCYRQAGIPVPADIAGLLMAGLISDTLNLTSPTTTRTDAEVLSDLAAIAGVEADALAREIFSVGSPLSELSPREVIEADCKEYTEGGKRFAVAQIEELSLAELESRRALLVAELEEFVSARRLLFAALLVTDITTQNSVLLAVGEAAFLERIDYPTVGPNAWEMDQVVSRKKQLVPYLLGLIQQL